MNNKTRALLLLGVFILFLVSAGFLYNTFKGDAQNQLNNETQKITDHSVSDGSSYEDKRKASDFTLIDQYGKETSLSDYYGKPIIINFWASWCPPCKGEMPDFNQAFLEKGKDVNFLMVDLVDGYRETQADGEDYVSQQGFKFPVFFDINQEAAELYQVYSIPTTLFIDKNGYLVEQIQGPVSKEHLLEQASKLASE